ALRGVGRAAWAGGFAKHGPAAAVGGRNASTSKARMKRNVELYQAQQKKMSCYVETVGYLDAEGQTDVAAGVAGLVEEVNFREGDWVVKDQTLLVRIDPRKYEAMLAQAEAKLKRAEARVQKTEAAARRADAATR